mmetsp:Transcript_63157/g.150581  ORF Transcript_63157/g.150581 Transcript_63157/m.150581 type:complete len:255 (-) Transcript_63157:99-863(-)
MSQPSSTSSLAAPLLQGLLAVPLPRNGLEGLVQPLREQRQLLRHHQRAVQLQELVRMPAPACYSIGLLGMTWCAQLLAELQHVVAARWPRDVASRERARRAGLELLPRLVVPRPLLQIQASARRQSCSSAARPARHGGLAAALPALLLGAAAPLAAKPWGRLAAAPIQPPLLAALGLQHLLFLIELLALLLQCILHVMEEAEDIAPQVWRRRRFVCCIATRRRPAGVRLVGSHMSLLYMYVGTPSLFVAVGCQQ